MHLVDVVAQVAKLCGVVLLCFCYQLHSPPYSSVPLERADQDTGRAVIGQQAHSLVLPESCSVSKSAY